MKNTILIILALFIGLTACKKDEETEPEVNKDDLLCKTWQLDKEYINGEENQAMIDTDYEFIKGGIGIATVHIGEGLIFNIEWRWTDDQQSLEMIFLGTKTNFIDFLNSKNLQNFNATWTKVHVVKLTSKELILEEQGDTETLRMELSEK
jgi:hypothetical protein